MRLLPAYYATWLLTAAVFAAIPAIGPAYHPTLVLPHSFDAWATSLLFYHPHPDGDVIHVAWAVRVEIFFYLFMALGMARGVKKALVWFAASVVATIVLVATGADFEERYASLVADSLPFSVGVLLFHFRDRFPNVRSPWVILAVTAVWWLYIPFSYLLPIGGWAVLGLYGSIITSALMLVYLAKLDPRQYPAWVAKIDTLLGDLSYPIYLCHWTAAVVASWLTGGKGRYSFSVLLIGFCLTHVVAYAILRLVEIPTRRWKIRVGPSPALAAANAPADQAKQGENVASSQDQTSQPVLGKLD